MARQWRIQERFIASLEIAPPRMAERLTLITAPQEKATPQAGGRSSPRMT
jgi:hypothetical protein